MEPEDYQRARNDVATFFFWIFVALLAWVVYALLSNW